MATLLARVTVKPDMEDHWEGIAHTVFSATHENEPAVRRYEYFRGTAPRTYYVLLSFDDFDGFMTHQVADYHHNAGFGDCFEDFSLEWLDPIQGASDDLVPSQTSGTPKAGDDLWNAYVENHSDPTPDWWGPLRG